jgi:hypothetical protein
MERGHLARMSETGTGLWAYCPRFAGKMHALQLTRASPVAVAAAH